MRSFDKADADIRIGATEFKTSLPMDRCLIALQQTPTETAMFAADGPLTREQLELLDTPSGRIHLSELLPAKEVKLDETWSIPDGVICRLLCLDAVTQCEVNGTLKTVVSGVANVQFEGNVAGTVSGIASEIQLKAKYHFDIRTSQITWLGMAIREERAIGHAEPGFETCHQGRHDITPDG